ncbi:MAG TPA: 50S ribosomal protein L11 methyltransferase [Patescibacteria group bacterium]|nr:50S ribosomal protein L11 methyltransferase [Patescibacteria group bacterium]
MPEWRRITFSVTQPAQEDLIVRLHELGSLGVETVGPSLCAYFTSGIDETALIRDVEQQLGGAARVRLVASEPVKDGFWHERWMEGLAPFVLGERFLVVPGPATPPDTLGRQVIRLTPGRAFGTGEHATTRMCVSLIERVVHPGDSVLDAGTGSGILSIAARMLGGDPVVGIDIDETSVVVASRNLAINAVDGVHLIAGTLEALQWRPFEVVVANINGSTLLRLMPSLSALTRREAILSGILKEEEREVAGAAARCGLTVTGRSVDGDWLALTLSREPRG